MLQKLNKNIRGLQQHTLSTFIVFILMIWMSMWCSEETSRLTHFDFDNFHFILGKSTYHNPVLT